MARLRSLATSRAAFPLVAALLLVAESVLCLAVIHRVPYTEIDWSTYMQQVAAFLAGERDYSLLKGSTGPIVYPAGFLYVYSALHYVTDQGRDIRTAQYIFAGTYLSTLATVFVLFHRSRSVPPYALVLLTLSKRLHSIYILRLFNDGIAMFFFYLSLLFFTSRRPRWSLGCVVFSLALGIKMNLLLFLPALAYILYTSLGLFPLLLHLSQIFSVQYLLAMPFLALPKQYLSTAFNFGRDFEWVWTVNWRWLGEETFSSRELKWGLLGAHLLGLGLCLLKWSGEEGGLYRLARRGITNPMRAASLSRRKMTPNRMMTLLFSTNLLGILCSRSLHYQFYAWYAHSVPFLLFQTPYDFITRLTIWGAIEFGFSTFPSTINSSLSLCMANLMLLVGCYYSPEMGQLRSTDGKMK